MISPGVNVHGFRPKNISDTRHTTPMTTTNQTLLLQHLVNITGHRDHSQLELAVVSALRQLMDIRRVRKLEFSTH